MYGRRRSSIRAIDSWRGPLAVCALALFTATPASAQDRPTDGMVIRRVDLRGLEAISEGFVRRVLKTRVGQNYREAQVQDDVRELLRTRKFLNVIADASIEEGQAVVVFTVQEKPTVRSVEVEGNKRFSEDELFKELAFSAGSVLDRFEVNRGRENIERKYREKGYYYATVQVDEEMLRLEDRVVYRVTEGPRVKVRKIVFEGVRAFPEPQLRFKLKTQTYFPIFVAGAFDEETADRDALEVQDFYRKEGYLDCRVGYRLDFQDVARTDLHLVFVVDEGLRYQVQEIVVEGNEVFDEERIRSVMQLQPGGFLRDETLQADRKRIEDLYGEIGYVDARIVNMEQPHEFLDQPGVVRLRLRINEGAQSRFGRITIRGNPRTKDEVVRRELRFYPGEEYNTVKAREAEKRLTETGLFNRATITPLEDVDGFREALVEVEEAQAINFIIGVGVSTDSGVIGQLSIENRNFDLFDWPRTWGEFFRGQAFRGDGQRLRLSAEPGTEVSRFRIDFTEPYFLDRPVRLDTSVYLFERDRESYDEERIGFLLAFSKRFETGLLRNWAGEIAGRVEGIDINDVRDLAANDIEDVKGNSFLTALKATLAHDTTDSRIVPTKGHRFSMAWEQVGALGGDYDFGRPSLSFAWYKTLQTDALDRKSVLGVRADAAYIVGDAPVFERFYAGGFGSIRGFKFRGITPRAGLFNDKVGGDFILLAGAEYSVPLYADNVRGVAFLDMGTVEEDFGIHSWRAAVGFGLRINLNFFGPVPIVFDFGFPIAEEEEDNNQVFNFSVGASF
ncbi:MAG: outer membrane protein assembly factor BamA [Phycisphaerae bacterium]